MNRNPVWLGFLTIIAVITAWFISSAITDVVAYHSLSARSPLQSIVWSVHKVSGGNFIPRAKYTYSVDEEEYTGTTDFELRSFRNEYGANQDIAKMREKGKDKEWMVWYDPSNPSVSAIDKWFPLSSSLSAGFMLAIFGYFIWLGRYVAKKAGE